MGILGFANADIEALGQHDEQVAQELDRRREEIEGVAALATDAA